MVAERSKATCNLSTDCSHQRTLVQIPLGDIYMVKILTKKELWTRNNRSLDCDMTPPKWVSEKKVMRPYDIKIPRSTEKDR